MDIFGASGHAKVIADVLSSNGIKDIRLWDDNEALSTFLGQQILGNFDGFVAQNSNEYLLAIGNNSIRKKLVEKLRETTSVAIHYASVIAKSAKIGVGTVVMSNASINADAVVGKHVIVNTNASIDHDCSIADYVHISPNAALAGAVTVGEGSHIGIGACVIQGISIGSWCIIGAGTVVIEDVADGCTVVGNPGRILKN
ncbi:sugar O-acyltransferase (sialic acid O-acetyltransferase NeuD family) [Pedobacter sp. UYEF25]